MPQFNTGNATWDQGLNSLGSSLFPDPSRIAQAGYYGAEQRNAQLQSAKTLDQMANMHRFQMMSNPGAAVPPPQWGPATGGTNMPSIMVDPTAPQGGGGGGAPPPQAPPPPLSATVAPGPQGQAPQAPPPPQPAAPPPPGTPVGANMSPASLSALMAGGGGAVPGPQQPQVTAQGPSGGAIVQPTMTPSQVANMTPAIIDAHPAMTQGTPPPSSPPAANTPPAPNTTGSDGSVPNTDQTSGSFHPGSITPQGGGTKTTGPANADGSPAAPQFTLSQYIAQAAAAGMDPQQANLQGRAYIDALHQKGMIDDNTYHSMMGSLDPSIINQDTASRTAITQTGMTQAGETQRTGMTQAGETQRTGMTLTTVTNPDGTVSQVPISQAQGPGGLKGAPYNPGLATEQARPLQVVPPGQTAPVNMPTSEATKPGAGTAYTPGTADIKQQQGGAYQTYVDPANPDAQPVTTTAADAAAKGLIPYGTTTPASQTPEQSFQLGKENYQSDQTAYPMPQAGVVNLGVTSPVAFTPEAQQAIDQRAQVLQQTARFRNNPAGAHSQAVRDLQGNGTLQSADEVNQQRQGMRKSLTGRSDPRVSSYTPPGGKPSDHMMVGLRNKQGAQPPQAAPPPTAPAPGPASGPPMSSVIAPPGVRTPQQMYGGAPTAPAAPPPAAPQAAPAPGPAGGPRIGRAPPGARPGAPAWVGTQQGVVGADGFVHAAG